PPAARGRARKAGGARRRRDVARSGARPRAPPLRARDGDRGPHRGHDRFPRAAPAGVQGALAVANVYETEFEIDEDREGFAYRAARVARPAGARRLGGSVYELLPGNAMFPYHYHLA